MRLTSFFAEAAALPPHLPNEVTGGKHWFHGTDAHFYDEDEGEHDPEEHKDPGGTLRAPDNYEPEYGMHAEKHWNTGLGVHFTSEHETAHQFASHGRYEQSRIAHCRLHMANPKHYDSEFDMSREAVKYAHSKGLHYLDQQAREDPEVEDHMDQGGHYGEMPNGHAERHDHLDYVDASLNGAHRTAIDQIDRGDEHQMHHHYDNYLRYHPDREEITEGFKAHLESKGHDGVTYGNEFEAPIGHKCAIAFHPESIHMDRWQWLHPKSEQHNKQPTDNRPDPQQPELLGRSYTPSEGYHWRSHEDQKLGAKQVRTLYHATGYGRPEQIDQAGHLRASENGESGPGVYLSQDRAYAEKLSSGKPNATTYEVEATIHNPLVRHSGDSSDPGEQEYREIQRNTDGWHTKPGAALAALQERGYDAVESFHPWGHEIAVHDPAAVKIVKRHTAGQADGLSYTKGNPPPEEEGTYYHGTSYKNWVKIRDHGLQGHESDPRVWIHSDPALGALVANGFDHPHANVAHTGGGVLLKVKGLDPKRITEQFTGHTHDGPIPREHIEMVHPKDWHSWYDNDGKPWAPQKIGSSAPQQIYRAEHRPPDADLEHPASIGVHWTTKPIDYGYQHQPGWKRVVWHGTVDPQHIEDQTDRFGEGEVVLRNGGTVHLTGRTERLDRGLVDVAKDGTPEHPMSLDTPISGRRISKKTAMPVQPERQGLCYPYAYEHLKSLPDEAHGRLVHGSINGGKVANHAWVEFEHEGQQMVHEPTYNEDFPATFYHQNAHPQAEAKYTKEEAMVAMLKHGHYGPWHQGHIEPREAGARGGLPEGIQFEHVERPDHHQILATDSYGFGLGELSWWKDNEFGKTPGRILNLEVHNNHRRKGIATEMLRRAREVDPTVHHSDALSDDAKGWIKSVGTVLPGYTHEHDWLPNGKVFAPSRGGLDPILFDEHRKMYPGVHQVIFDRIQSVLEPAGLFDWHRWSRVYLAGSEASEWWGNRDFDTLIGVNYEEMRAAHPEHGDLSDDGISDLMNAVFRKSYNDEDWIAPWDGEVWHLTAFVNPDSWDIRRIKPYAAYNMTADTWAVEPVVVGKDWGPEKWPEGTWDMLESYLALIKAIEALPHPEQERQGANLYDWLHTDRRRAFSDHGTGWSDIGNVIWKALDLHPSEPLTKLVNWKHMEAADAGETEVSRKWYEKAS